MAVASSRANRASRQGYRLIAAGLLLSKARLTETSCLTPYGPATSAGRHRHSISILPTTPRITQGETVRGEDSIAALRHRLRRSACCQLGREVIAAGLLNLAGVTDHGEVERWTRVGYERGEGSLEGYDLSR